LFAHGGLAALGFSRNLLDGQGKWAAMEYSTLLRAGWILKAYPWVGHTNLQSFPALSHSNECILIYSVDIIVKENIEIHVWHPSDVIVRSLVDETFVTLFVYLSVRIPKDHIKRHTHVPESV
jgi:hypothetical protein